MNKYRYKNKTLEINIYKYKCVQNSPPFYEKSGDSFSENYYKYMYFNLNSHNFKGNSESVHKLSHFATARI